MDLTNVVQVALFVLPGFLCVEVVGLLTPVKLASEDARIVTFSIAVSAVIWMMATVAVGIVSVLLHVATHRALGGLPGSLWTSWFADLLGTAPGAPIRLLPGVIVNILGAALGFGFARYLTEPSGRLRRFSLGRVSFDLNPAVGIWYFQDPDKGRFYLVTMKTGRRFVGAIKNFWLDPHEVQQDLVFVNYSEVGLDGHLSPVTHVDDLLVSRADIDWIEKFPTVTVPVVTG